MNQPYVFHFSLITCLFSNPKLLLTGSQTKANKTDVSFVTISGPRRLVPIQILGQKQMRIHKPSLLGNSLALFYWLLWGWQLTCILKQTPANSMLYLLISPFTHSILIALQLIYFWLNSQERVGWEARKEVGMGIHHSPDSLPYLYLCENPKYWLIPPNNRSPNTLSISSKYTQMHAFRHMLF